MTQNNWIIHKGFFPSHPCILYWNQLHSWPQRKLNKFKEAESFQAIFSDRSCTWIAYLSELYLHSQGITQTINLVIIINSFKIFTFKSFNFHLLHLNIPTIFISIEKHLLHTNVTSCHCLSSSVHVLSTGWTTASSSLLLLHL